MATTTDIFLKRKLTLLAVIGTGVGLLLACGAVMYAEMQASMAENLSTVARVVAAQSRAALSAKNPAIARALIDILPAAPAIASAAIYTDDGVVVASYLRDQKEAPIPPMPANYGLEKAALFLSLTEPIVLDGKRLGTLYLRSDLGSFPDHIKEFRVLILVILLTSALVIVLSYSLLEKMIFAPILQLTQTMSGVSKDKNYSVRIPKRANDELGKLSEGFNEMLGQIQKRDAVSEKARIVLENRMEEWTSKLQEEVAERTRLEQQLLQAQKMEALGQLAGGIAHDFNNLLTVIMGNLSLARLQSGQDGKIAALLQAAEQGTHRASDLTRQLLAVGRRTFNLPKALDLHDVVTEVVQILKRTIDPRIVIETPAAQVVWLVYVDSGQMFQALMNLCVNARDAMPEGGRLQIALENVTRKTLGKDNPALEAAPGCFVRLIVSDTGIGMEPETCRRIFEPFFTTKEVGKGMGLGLAMVYGIVTQNKGTITVDSKVRLGSRFTIELPRHFENEADQAISAALVAQAAVPKTAEGGGETVLVVEDEDQIRKLARKVLEQLGYVVLEAEDGVRGLTVYQEEQHRIAAVILDLTMPKKSGLEVLSTLRRLDPNVRVILSSGYSAAAQKLDLAKLGVMAFLQKPYVPNDLARTLRNVLDQAP
ncbi:MAG TPA: response regulator [Nitrospirales bacterium]|jgi:signal transduction histidine kinase/ActR/RegA family two-component response regulator